MNRQTIEEKLLLFREGIDDPEAPEWVDFFRALEQEPDLKAIWEADQQDTREELCFFNSLTPPEGLLSAILASQAAAEKKVIPFTTKYILPFSTAALLFFAFTVFVLNRDSSNSPEGMLSQPSEVAQTLEWATLKGAVMDFEDNPQFQFTHNNLETVQQHLTRELGFDVSRLAIPPGLLSRATNGCAVVDVNGHRVSLICFQMGNGNRIHLFAIPRSAIRQPPSATAPFFEETRYGSAASWSDQHMSYFMLSRGQPARQGLESLRTILVNQ